MRFEIVLIKIIKLLLTLKNSHPSQLGDLDLDQMSNAR